MKKTILALGLVLAQTLCTNNVQASEVIPGFYNTLKGKYDSASVAAQLSDIPTFAAAKAGNSLTCTVADSDDTVYNNARTLLIDSKYIGDGGPLHPPTKVTKILYTYSGTFNQFSEISDSDFKKISIPVIMTENSKTSLYSEVTVYTGSSKQIYASSLKKADGFIFGKFASENEAEYFYCYKQK